MDDTSPPFARRFTHGNRCGHDPNAPDLYDISPPAGANPYRPALINLARERCPDIYLHPRATCWEECSQIERRQRLQKRIDAAGGPHTPEGQLLYEKLKKWHQQRSERREVKAKVVSFVLLYTDIINRLIGVPGPKGIQGLSLAWIAERINESLSRVRRAFRTLELEGLIVTVEKTRHRNPKTGQWVYEGWGAVRQITRRLIEALDLQLAWDHEHKRLKKAKAATQEEARPRDQTTPPNRQATQAQVIQTLMPTLRLERAVNPTPPAPQPPAPPPPLRPAPSPASREALQAETARRNQQVLDLLRQGVAPEEVYQRLKQGFP